ncbi:MAG: FadR/GntR family transcriptional regulator [Massiliimalia sp.]
MKPITDQVLDYLKKEITSGTWMVGDKIPSENQLIHTLGVSRASLRSALHRLCEVGVLKTIHGKGSFLMDNRVEDALAGRNTVTAEEYRRFRELLEFRIIVESEACYLAVKNRTDQLIHDLESCLELMKRYDEDPVRFVGADMLFHKAISRASNNLFIAKVMQNLFEESKQDHCQMNRAFGYQDGIFYHTKILEAVSKGDPEEARSFMRQHLQNGIERLNQCPIEP